MPTLIDCWTSTPNQGGGAKKQPGSAAYTVGPVGPGPKVVGGNVWLVAMGRVGGSK